jgi:hypothetical protein
METPFHLIIEADPNDGGTMLWAFHVTATPPATMTR